MVSKSISDKRLSEIRLLLYDPFFITSVSCCTDAIMGKLVAVCFREAFSAETLSTIVQCIGIDLKAAVTALHNLFR